MSELQRYNPKNPAETHLDHAFFTADLPNSVKLEMYKDRILVMLESVRCYLTDEGFSYDLHGDPMQTESTRQKFKLTQRKVFDTVMRVRNILLFKRWCINTPTQLSQKKIDQLTNDELIELAELATTTTVLPKPIEPDSLGSRPPRAE